MQKKRNSTTQKCKENPFKKFIELKSNKSNRLEHNLNFPSHLQYLKQRPKETDSLNQRERERERERETNKPTPVKKNLYKI